MFGVDISKPVRGQKSIEVERPPCDVFNYVGARFFDNYPKWAPEVLELQPLSDGAIRPGFQARQVRMDQGQRSESTFEIEHFEPCTRLSLKGLSAPYRAIYQFEPHGEGSGTHLTFTFELLDLELFMRPFEKLIRVAIEEGAECTVNNLKHLVESS